MKKKKVGWMYGYEFLEEFTLYFPNEVGGGGGGGGGGSQRLFEVSA